MVTVDTLYTAYDALQHNQNSDNVQTHLQTLINSVKSQEPQVRTLAAQFLPQFMHRIQLESLRETALNAQLDLCEDADLSVRLHAIRGLGVLCKTRTNHVSRIADILGQLIATSDTKELVAVKTTFEQVIALSPIDALQPLFRQVCQDAEIRDAGFAFLCGQLGELEFEKEEVKQMVITQMITLAQSEEVPSEYLIKLVSIVTDKGKVGKEDVYNMFQQWSILNKPFSVIHSV